MVTSRLYYLRRLSLALRNGSLCFRKDGWILLFMVLTFKSWLYFSEAEEEIFFRPTSQIAHISEVCLMQTQESGEEPLLCSSANSEWVGIRTKGYLMTPFLCTQIKAGLKILIVDKGSPLVVQALLWVSLPISHCFCLTSMPKLRCWKSSYKLVRKFWIHYVLVWQGWSLETWPWGQMPVHPRFYCCCISLFLLVWRAITVMQPDPTV